MDPSSPAATKQDQPSPTQADEDEVIASLLLLKEAAGPDEGFDLDKENHLVPDEPTFEVNMDVEKEASNKTALVTSSLVDEFSADEAVDEEEKESPEQGDKNEEHQGDDDDELEEEEVRRCNRNNGRGWFCNELAEPGFATCLPHILSRRETYHRFRLKKLQGSTSRSDQATVEHKTEDAAATSAVGDQEEAAVPSFARDTCPCQVKQGR